jgi:hypothetical protein
MEATMFERHNEPLLPLPQFFGRIARALGVAIIIDGVALPWVRSVSGDWRVLTGWTRGSTPLL